VLFTALAGVAVKVTAAATPSAVPIATHFFNDMFAPLQLVIPRR
jgi:hypothetical protein